MKLSEAIAFFSAQLTSMGDVEKCIVSWDASDIIGRHEGLLERGILEEGPLVTKEEAYAALATMERRHDNEIGITWDTIDVMIEDILKQRSEEEKIKEEVLKITRDIMNGASYVIEYQPTNIRKVLVFNGVLHAVAPGTSPLIFAGHNAIEIKPKDLEKIRKA